MEWHDGKPRCRWANPNNPRYLQYHDQEWGVPVYDDAKLFEMLILENFQAGLSWECVLNKWGAFRRAFDGFDLEKVCAYDDTKINALRNDSEWFHLDRRSLNSAEAIFLRKLGESLNGPDLEMLNRIIATFSH